MKKIYLILIFVFCFLSSLAYARTTQDELIENNILGVNDYDLVNVNETNSTGTIMPRIYFFTMRQGFFFYIIMPILLIILMLLVVVIVFKILLDIIYGVFNNKYFKK